MKDTYKFDVTVIGAGILGLAIAAKFSQSGQSVVLVEQQNTPGSITTSRNSEVIHAGIYYKKNSLKQKLCFEGNKGFVAQIVLCRIHCVNPA
jgi:L-2-hydroxyglutarate oxidase LhgO